MVSIAINQDWVPYIAGAMMVLLNASTWDTNSKTDLDDMRGRVVEALNIVNGYTPVAPPIQFQRNETNPVQWDYSLDAGETWLAGPDNWRYFYPEFTVDTGTPSGYQLSVNHGNEYEPVPVIDDIVGNAVRNNPASDLTNTITSATGITPLELISGGTVSLLIESQQRAIDISRVAGFDVSSAEEFLKITKTVADIGDILVTVLLS
jgi:hypothetical protein